MRTAVITGGMGGLGDSISAKMFVVIGGVVILPAELAAWAWS